MSLTLLVCVFVEVGLAVDKNSPRRGGIAEQIGESLEARRFLAWLSCQRPPGVAQRGQQIPTHLAWHAGFTQGRAQRLKLGR
jgi:hypothetical protein